MEDEDHDMDMECAPGGRDAARRLAPGNVVRTLLKIAAAAALAGCGGESGPGAGQRLRRRTSSPSPTGSRRWRSPPDNPMTEEGVALGRRLFFDPILSADGATSCASCHRPEFAFSDPEPVSSGVAGSTRRNSMALANAGWSRVAVLGRPAPPAWRSRPCRWWRIPSSWGSPGRTSSASCARTRSTPGSSGAPFGDVPITRGQRRTGRSPSSSAPSFPGGAKFDRVLAGQEQFTEVEELGLELFFSERGDCFHCHGTLLFTDGDFHNTGLDEAPADSGRVAVTGRRLDYGKFKSPSLRNVEFTAPYMHDGRFPTLEEVLDHYDSGLHLNEFLDPLLLRFREPRNFTREEREALVAFLLTLSDPAFARPMSP